jgi:hypothetical protein
MRRVSALADFLTEADLNELDAIHFGPSRIGTMAAIEETAERIVRRHRAAELREAAFVAEQAHYWLDDDSACRNLCAVAKALSTRANDLDPQEQP